MYDSKRWNLLEYLLIKIMAFLHNPDFGFQVARGLVPGVTSNIKFGRNVDTVSGDTIWSSSTAYTEPSAFG